MNTPFCSLAAVLIFAQCAGSQNMNCTKITAKCPSADQWSKREGLFNCPGKKRYVCLMTPQTELQEGCIFDTTINAGKLGCPYATRCDPRTNQPVLVTHKNYLPCDPDVKGCPSRNHVGYSILKIYKYPKCQGRDGYNDSSVSPERVAPVSSTTPPDSSDQNGTFAFVLGIVISSFFIGICISSIIVAHRKQENSSLLEHYKGENQSNQCATENCKGIVTNDIIGQYQSKGTYLICEECSRLLNLKNVLCDYVDHNLLCGKHAQNVEKFCQECDKYTCNICITEHPDHSLIDLSVRLDQLKSNIHTEIINNIESKLASFKFDETHLEKFNKVMRQSRDISEEHKRSRETTNNKSIEKLKKIQKDLENKKRRLKKMIETGQIKQLECTLSSACCLSDADENVYSF